MSKATKKQLILLKVLGMLGFETVDLNVPWNSLRYQKTIYLLQNYGVSLGSGYEWYVRGPYSTELAYDLEQLHFLIHGTYPERH